jgi:hypothetical protein
MCTLRSLLGANEVSADVMVSYTMTAFCCGSLNIVETINCTFFFCVSQPLDLMSYHNIL